MAYEPCLSSRMSPGPITVIQRGGNTTNPRKRPTSQRFGMYIATPMVPNDPAAVKIACWLARTGLAGIRQRVSNR